MPGTSGVVARAPAKVMRSIRAPIVSTVRRVHAPASSRGLRVHVFRFNRHIEGDLFALSTCDDLTGWPLPLMSADRLVAPNSGGAPRSTREAGGAAGLPARHPPPRCRRALWPVHPCVTFPSANHAIIIPVSRNGSRPPQRPYPTTPGSSLDRLPSVIFFGLRTTPSLGDKARNRVLQAEVNADADVGMVPRGRHRTARASISASIGARANSI